jgi:ribosomal protein L11 methylase PrmA
LTYTEVVFPADDLDRAQASLYLAGCGGVSERSESGRSVAAAFFSDNGRAGEASRMLREAGIANRLVEASADDDPMAAFRAGARPFVVGPFQIDPRDETAAQEKMSPGLLRLRVPASRAFGTGLHESTAGILRFLGESPPKGGRVLDIGCGSGILSIAASVLGAEFCVGFDLDCDAVFEAGRNLTRNPAIGRVSLFAGSIEGVEGPFDLVLANMIFEEVAPILPAISLLVAPGGRAVFAGILEERTSDARIAIRAAGLSFSKHDSDGTWSRFETQK